MFEVGDRVRSRVKINTRDGKIEVGEVGTVWEVGRNVPAAGVKFDRDIGGHDLGMDGRSCEHGYGWYMVRDEIEKIDDENKVKKEVTKLQFDAEARDKVVNEIRKAKSRTQKLFDSKINDMMKATTIEEIMEAKKELLFGIVEGMPLSADSCYFCHIYLPTYTLESCEKCLYGKKHGRCNNLKSDWTNIKVAGDAFMCALASYYEGEKYTEEPRELAAGDMVAVKDGSWTMTIDKEGKMRPSTGRELRGRRLRIVETDKQGLPTERPSELCCSDIPDNDTILQDIDTNEIVFIQKEFLVRVS